MADKELVARLRRSVYEWNQWCKQHPARRPLDLSGASLSRADLNYAGLSRADLSGADLSGADLRGANLSRANLSGADLNYADLSRASLSSANLSGASLGYTDLSGANLTSADLSGANLSGADLRSANFSSVNLSHADLSRANLGGANLTSVQLNRANFTRSQFNHTLFVEVDLSAVQGLEAATHRGPSTVNINSMILPHDEPTRRHFLLGVGFTEHQIDYLPSLFTLRPIQYHSLFISYTHQDEDLAHLLFTDLRKKNVSCWFAPHDLRPGNYIRKHIDQAIHTQDKVLLLLSEYSVKSGWVEYEMELALARENRQQREILFPLRLDDAIFSCTASWAVSLQATRHIGDFTGWQREQRYQEAFALLLRHLKTEPPLPLNLP